VTHGVPTVEEVAATLLALVEAAVIAELLFVLRRRSRLAR
jgi:hypothetical protein